ncbi:MAG TPA: UDP-N-acetylmuramoyl-L-alanyl-D-glutamate--2,6-diaminopimelate ligase [Dehalococcoidia bacterium]|nr:UDP-N-acetylmuramoyl-L-alanyl-D-glutamate--2,6-diaminopimelate ligase [Dehalococcoidia bacterium]
MRSMGTASVLNALIEEIPGAELVRGDGETIIQQVEHDSRRVADGFLFVAVPGFTVDGHDFLIEALNAGAAAVVVERGRRGMWRHLPGTQAIVAVPDTRIALAQAAAALHRHPSRELTVIGITGTDGKTTTAYILTAILEVAGARVGRLGTVDAYVSGANFDSRSHRMTTPEAPEVQRLLRAMVDEGCGYAIVEATSHGLALNRLDMVEFDISVLTNLTGDHLDFHESFEAYREAKGKLFSALDRTSERPGGPIRAAVANADDPSASFLLGLTECQAVRYGLDNPNVDVTARDIELHPDGSSFLLALGGAEVGTEIRMPALFNVANALAAAGAAAAVGIEPEVIGRGIAACQGVPGRMERIDMGQPFNVVVDYAHTGDSVRKVLAVLRELADRKLIIVAGAAGERDPGRRFGVGRAVAEGADFAVFTNEDPRGEVPAMIVREIGRHAEEAGLVSDRDFIEVEDRREAIAAALGRAEEGDSVVICGKGHERSIELGGASIPWDDREVTREELAKLGYNGD